MIFSRRQHYSDDTNIVIKILLYWPMDAWSSFETLHFFKETIFQRHHFKSVIILPSVFQAEIIYSLDIALTHLAVNSAPIRNVVRWYSRTREIGDGLAEMKMKLFFNIFVSSLIIFPMFYKSCCALVLEGEGFCTKWMQEMGLCEYYMWHYYTRKPWNSESRSPVSFSIHFFAKVNILIMNLCRVRIPTGCLWGRSIM